MIGEEEQQCEADKQQYDRDGHPEPRELIHPVPTRNPYCQRSSNSSSVRG
jgi:hypothetical protein